MAPADVENWRNRLLKRMPEPDVRDCLEPHYNFNYSEAVWGKTAKRLAKEGCPVMVMLRPEVAAVFKDEDSVNDALQSLIEILKRAGTANGAKEEAGDCR